MAASGVIVRRLESIENFGSMDILCTDKTGTLTVGVVQLDGALDTQGNPSPQVMRLAYLNAHFQTGLPNPLDDAIVASGNQDLSGVAKLDEVPYDFVRKRLSLVIQEGPEKELPICMITKGAFENVLSVCDRLQSDGHSLPLTEAEKNGLHQRYEEWSEQGYRVLGLAVKESRQPAPAAMRSRN